MKHGGASTIEVRLGLDLTDGPALALDVDNDGAPPPASPALSGLARLAAALEVRGGSLALRPGPDGGARLSARVPLRLSGAPSA